VLIWLASYPKSGNTWLRLFLGCWLADHPISINELGQCGLGFGDARPDLYEGASGKPVAEISHDEVTRLRPLIQRNMAVEERVFMKTHSAMAVINGHPTIVREVTEGAVYVVRDPRDVAVSFASHYGLDVDGAIEHMAAPDHRIKSPGVEIYQYTSSWSLHVESWTGEESFPVLLLRYEDMKTKPGPTFNKLVRWLGEIPKGGEVARAIRNTEFSKLKRQEAEQGFVEASDKASGFFRSGRAGGWRDVLTATQVKRIEDEHGTMMARLGYRREER